MQDTIENLEWEIWKDIPWWEWLYTVSNFWRVICLSSWKLKKWWLSKCGYAHIWFWKKWNSKIYMIHRLVAIVFIKNVDNKPQVNHKDWDKQNNCSSNLEWVTCSENIKHAYKNWLMNGENAYFKKNPPHWKIWWLHHKSKSVKQFTLEGKLINIFPWIRDAERITWISNQCIIHSCKGRKKNGEKRIWWWYIWEYNI